MAWAGWGAGPAGAGAAGPSKAFLGLGLLAAAVAGAAMLRDGHALGGAVALLCACYFALRLFAGLGRRGRGGGKP